MTATRPAAGRAERAREQDRGELADRERDHRRADDAHGAARRRMSGARRGSWERSRSLTVVSSGPRTVRGSDPAPAGQQRRAGSTIVRVVRILLVTPGLGLGGSERLTLALCARPHGARPRGARRARAAGALRDPPTSRASRVIACAERLSARTAADWFRALRSIAAEFRPGRRAHAVGPLDGDRRDRAAAHAAARHGARHRGVGGARRGARCCALGRARVTAVSRGLRRGRQASPLGPAASSSCLPGVDIEAARARRARGARDGDPRAQPARRVRRAPLPGQGRRRARRGLPAGARRRARRRPRAGRRRTDHETLIARVAELGIADAVHFAGRQHNPAPYLAAPTSSCFPRDAKACRSRRSRRSHSSAPSWPPPSAERPTSSGRARRAGSCRPSSRPRWPPRIIEALLDPARMRAARSRGRALVEAAIRPRS